MKFIAVLNDINDVERVQVGMSNEDITTAIVVSVARQEYGVFTVADKYQEYPTSTEYRIAAQKLLKLADQIDRMKA